MLHVSCYNNKEVKLIQQNKFGEWKIEKCFQLRHICKL